LFRERIHPRWPARYYLLSACLIVAAIFAWMEYVWPALAVLAIWLALTIDFAWRRLKSTRRVAAHVAEMLVTSLAIPFLSIYWRLYGALRFRTLFW
jgi:hypothetical protein